MGTRYAHPTTQTLDGRHKKLYMKKLFLFFLLLFPFSIFAESSFKEGRYGIGGAGGYSYRDGENYNWDETFYLSPSAMYFVKARLAIGMQLGFQTKRSSYRSSKIFSVGPEARYYWDFLAINPFVFGKLIVVLGNRVYLPTNNTDLIKAGEAQLGIGLNYFLNQNVAMEPIISFGKSNSNISFDPKYFQNELEIRYGFIFFIN